MTTTVTRLLLTPCVIRYYADGPPDEHNDPTALWTEVDTICQIQQRQRGETGDMAEIPTSTWGVWLLPTEDLPHSTDQLIANGITYTFRGNAALTYDLRGNPDHIEATVGYGAEFT